MDIGKDAVILKRVDVRKMLEDLIKISINLKKRYRGKVIELQKRFLIDTNVFIAGV